MYIKLKKKKMNPDIVARFKNVELGLLKEIKIRQDQRDGIALALAQLDERLKKIEKN